MDLNPAQHRARREHAKAAKAWTAATAARLQISPEAVEAAIRRGWTAQAIDRVTVAARLLEGPGADSNRHSRLRGRG